MLEFSSHVSDDEEGVFQVVSLLCRWLSYEYVGRRLLQQKTRAVIGRVDLSTCSLSLTEAAVVSVHIHYSFFGLCVV